MGIIAEFCTPEVYVGIRLGTALGWPVTAMALGHPVSWDQ